MAPPVLSHRSFRWLLAGSLVTYLSQWMQQASLSWVAYEITGSAAILGAVFAVRAIPMIGFAPFAGVAADRYERKALLRWSQLSSAAVSFLFGTALAFGLVTTWVLFLFTVVMGTCAVLDRPARNTLVFEMVPRESAMKAVGLHSMVFSLNRMAGPAAAGYLIGLFGVTGNFFIQTFLYLVAVALGFGLVIPKRVAPPRDASALKELSTGFRFLFSNRTIRLVLAFGLIPYFLLVPIWSTLLPVYAKDVFSAGPEGFGMLLAGVGVGATLGGLATVWLARFDRQGAIQISAMLVYCASIVGLAVSPSLVAALPIAVIGGASEIIFTTSQMTTLQMAAPEAMRGRVSSLLQLFPGFISLGAVVCGALAEALGPRPACALLAGICAIIVLALYSGSARLRGLRLSHYR
jgi:MFS transporter, DHA1 family, staphyloferrin A biosynthesis exporter